MLLRDRQSFVYETVDLYEDFYDISDNEYLSRIEAQKQDITDLLLQLCMTKRRNLYIPADSVLTALEKRFRLHRVGERYGDLILSNYLSELVQSFIEEGKLAQADTKRGVGLRTVKEK